MSKIWHLPIEEYETRYTADWVSEFEDEFEKANIPYETIKGDRTTSKLKVGQVLDCCGTHLYKFSQLQKLIQKINNNEVKDNDIIFFSDLWFPGLESLFYIRNISKINFKISGVLHAGTWDEYDFTSLTGMGKWAKSVEYSWLTGVDCIFVATNFHKSLIENYFGQLFKNIFVTGIPFYFEKLQKFKLPKENIIVFPHRNAKEKNPDLFNELSNKQTLQKFKFVKTLDVCKSRNDYFALLGKAKYMVSFAEQETFGYSTVESMALNCKVFVPDALSYKETVPSGRYYAKKEEWVSTVEEFIIQYEQDYKLPNYDNDLKKWSKSIPNMIEVLRSNNGV